MASLHARGARAQGTPHAAVEAGDGELIVGVGEDLALNEAVELIGANWPPAELGK